MTLTEKQFTFASLIPLLITKAIELGYTITLGEAYRSPEEAARLAKAGLGIKNSLHTSRLAIDLNLFRNGVYQKDAEAYRALGNYWESLSVGKPYNCDWGGHFDDPDHFSLGDGGRQ